MTCLAALGAVIVAAFQLRENTKQMALNSEQLQKNIEISQESTQLNKKIATETKLKEYQTLSIDRLKQNNTLNYMGQTDNSTPIELETIYNEIAKDTYLRNDIHKLLNYYESVARGVRTELYDKDLVMAHGYNRMKRMFIKYQKYIEERRMKNPKAWDEFVHFIKENS